MTLPLDLSTPVTGRPAVLPVTGHNAGTAGKLNQAASTARSGETVSTTPAVPAFEVHVFGQPAPQGSKSAFVNKHTGRASLVESSKRVKPWREAVKHAALDVMAMRHTTTSPFWILNQPLFVYTVYTFIRPTTHYRTGRNAHLLRDAAPAYPCTRNKNDLEKLDRSTRDALTDAGVWTDDSLVVHHDSWKVFSREHCDALPVAGAVIRIYALSAFPQTDGGRN